MNIGEINGVQVAVSPEAYEEIKKQKIIEENKNKIEKLSYEATRLFAGGKLVKSEVDVDIVTIIDKINEIIDKINNTED